MCYLHMQRWIRIPEIRRFKNMMNRYLCLSLFAILALPALMHAQVSTLTFDPDSLHSRHFHRVHNRKKIPQEILDSLGGKQYTIGFWNDPCGCTGPRKIVRRAWADEEGVWFLEVSFCGAWREDHAYWYENHRLEEFPYPP